MAGEIYMKTIIDTTKIEAPVWCAVCRLEIEEEGIEIDGTLYHYNCSGEEL
jgi:hypothetical protein